MAHSIAGDVFHKTKFDQINKANVTYVLSLIRREIERKNQRLVFQALGFYCDWILHSSIDKNKYAYNVLLKLNEAYVKTMLLPETGQQFTNDTLRALGTHELHTDLLRFFKLNGIDRSHIKNRNVWKKFCSTLFECLIDVPVMYPTSPGGSTAKAGLKIEEEAKIDGNLTRYGYYCKAFSLQYAKDEEEGRWMGSDVFLCMEFEKQWPNAAGLSPPILMVTAAVGLTEKENRILMTMYEY